MLPRSLRLHTAADFRRVRGRGRKWESPSFLAFSTPYANNPGKLGLIVSAKIGGSVTRKRVSRIFREGFRRAQISGVEVVLIARPYATRKTSSQIQRELEQLSQKWRT